MERTEAFEQVKKIVVDALGADASEVKESASFSNDLGADSLDRVELVMAFEDELKLTIPDTDAEQLLTVGQVVDYLIAHK